MAAPSAVDPPVSIPRLLGGFLVMICVAFALYGVTSAQAYVYSLTCKDDPRWMKRLVAVIWVLETAHSAFALRLLYYMVITSFGDYELINKIDWSLGVLTVCEIFIIFLVEGYYIRRIWILSNGSRILGVLLVTLLLCRLGFTLCTCIYTLIVATWNEFQQSFGPHLSVLLTNSSSAVIDGVIAISMIFLLQRGRAGFNYGIDSVLRFLMVYCVNTGAISMMVSVTIAITYSTLKNNLIFAGLVVLMGKLYSNALLGMLNARPFMRRRVAAVVEPNIVGLSGVGMTPMNGRPPSDMGFEQKSHLDASDAIIVSDGRRYPLSTPSGDDGIDMDILPSQKRSRSPIDLNGAGSRHAYELRSVKIEIQKEVETREDI